MHVYSNLWAYFQGEKKGTTTILLQKGWTVAVPIFLEAVGGNAGV
jgi:hypothetical protein